MKRLLIWLLVAGLLLAPAAALAEEAYEETFEEAPAGINEIAAPEMVVDPIEFQPDTELVVGSTTQMNGYFATDMWGTNTADMDVRMLLHDYATIVWMKTYGIALNGVAIEQLSTVDNPSGNRSYVFTIKQGLTYNDGTPITAKDYVFSLLMSSSPLIAQLGGTPRGLDFLVGYEAYRSGQTSQLGGVRLISDYEFSMEIATEQMPYFYGIALLSTQPYPISVIAPGCDVYDMEGGAYIGPAEGVTPTPDTQLGYTPGEFSEGMLRYTLLDPVNGYVFNPRVTSGAYQLESYDQNTHEAQFTVNPQYAGNYEGQKPHIERLVFRHVYNETMADELKSGEVGLLNKVTDKAAFDAVQALVDTDNMQLTNYQRSGFAFLAFACDRGPTASKNVRNAIARSLDKATLVDQALGTDRGMAVHGYYGLGQWMLAYVVDQDEQGQATNGMQAMEQFAVSMDLEEAKRLLEADGWNLNANGDPFAEGSGAVRYREENGQLTSLTIHWAKSARSDIADQIEEMLKEPFAELGIELDVTTMPFSYMLQQYYSGDEREYDMYFLGTNFYYLFDPYYEFNTADEYQGLINTSGLRDETLMNLALDMRQTDPSDVQGYMDKWLAFQERWIEEMPMMPLYSNVYTDAYRWDLQGYDIGSQTSWALAIPYAYFGEPPADALGLGEEQVVEPDYTVGDTPVQRSKAIITNATEGEEIRD